MSPSSVAAGSTASIAAAVTSSASISALVDVEVYNSGGSKMFQQSWDTQSLPAGQAVSYAAAWSVPSTETSGSYTVEIGLFNPGWGMQLY